MPSYYNDTQCDCTASHTCYMGRCARFYIRSHKPNSDGAKLWSLILCAHRRSALPDINWIRNLSYKFYVSS